MPKHVFSMSKLRVGPGRACWSQQGSFGELLGRVRVPRGRLGEALGSSWGVLGSVWECFFDISGKLLGFRGRVESGKGGKVKFIVLPREFHGF